MLAILLSLTLFFSPAGRQHKAERKHGRVLSRLMSFWSAGQVVKNNTLAFAIAVYPKLGGKPGGRLHLALNDVSLYLDMMTRGGGRGGLVDGKFCAPS